MGRAAPPGRFAAALLLGLAGPSAVASAQSQGLVVRDGSLRAEPPQPVGAGLDPEGHWASYLITPEMGEQRGGNLFHSFSHFSIGTGETATFTGPDPIAGPQSVSNVISRVTGGDPSQIDGTLRSTIPGADVWLLNPSGVVFGEGATLDVKGSLHAGAADYVGLGEGGLERFYGDPSRPSVLATAPPAAFGFLPESQAASLAVEGSHLEVEPGEALELVGGDLSLTDAELLAPGGRVGLDARGEVALSASLVDVGRQGETPGTISIRGGQIVIQGDSQVLAENESPLPAGSNEPGPGSISVEGSESVLVDASLLSVSTQGAANAGTIQVAAPVVTFQNGPGYDPEKPPPATDVGASAETTGSGAGGDIQIHAGELLMLTNGVGVSATAVGSAASGDAGSIEIVAQEVVVEKGSHASDLGSHVSAETAGTGAGGSISIAAGESVDVDGGLLSVNTWSAGNAGTIRIAGFDGRPSPDVTFQNGIGYDAPVWTPTVADVGARAETTSSGAAGEIRINATKLLLQKGVAVQASAIGTIGGVERGKSGTVEIRAHSVEVLERSTIATGGWWSLAEPGRIRIDLGDDGSLLVDGRPQVPDDPAAYALIHSGNGTTPGTIEIEGGTVEVRDGGEITIQCFDTCTSKQAIRRDDQATLRIQVDELILSGGEITAPTNFFGDGATITVDAGSVVIGSGGRINAETTATGTSLEDRGGNAGHIHLVADSLEIQTGGAITANSRFGGAFGGDAGDIDITAHDRIFMTNVGGDRFDLDARLSGIFSATGGGGKAGTIALAAPEITVTEGAIVASSTIGGGAGGDVRLSGDRIRITNGGFVDTTTLPGGNPLAPGGNAGNVTLDAKQWIQVGGADAYGDTSYVASRSLEQDSGLTDLGDAGHVRLRAPNLLLFDRGSVTTIADQTNGGDITIQAQNLVHLDAGKITSSVSRGTGGNITIDPVFVILENGSRIEATAVTGHGGAIRITTDNFFAFPDSVVSADSKDQQLSGTVEIHSPDVDLAGDLTPLPSGLLDATSLMRARCAARRHGERAGSFAVRGPGGIPAEPDGWLPAPLVLDAAATAAAPAAPVLLASLPGRLLAHAACQ